ncbi:hypothetical protein TVAG_227250 [Trichomonas vaginalis G3]|uniref:Right handed beta helix domain-containing protein n=1 Tax=Trichomonas vaginalis (strain ATCC PRA-98 / G3) TaxID=412133 RepID=A2GA18_TRIV3|nr:pectin lyase-like family [Trichomonas vaginalis G3]EAX85999.1 hypothetical protein TVAG_227250 [Trichomonas vaginalis G3]KAI5546654.1 pectin lyase-like family [Trichomonas vaginalis G3]|eukprot:XP_001298929.1 hypothetical protein [Trichomonas vaginalis G3]
MSYYYLDGGNFATFRFAENKILSTTIQSCAPDSYGVNAFRSRDTSGNSTALNISHCNSDNTPIFTMFPSGDDSIKYSIFNENSAGEGSIYGKKEYDYDTYGIAVVYSGNFTIESCCFSNNSASFLIYSSHSVKVIFKNTIFIGNKNDYIAYADQGNNGQGISASEMFINNCYFEEENTNLKGATGGKVLYDRVNNYSIKSEVINQIQNQLRTVPITDAQSIYHL